MAGSVGDATRLKVAVGTAAIACGPASMKKRAIPTPPIATKTGAPSRKATITRIERKSARCDEPSARPSRKAAPVAATIPPRSSQRHRPSPATQAKRSAMAAKPIGITSWLQAIRMPKATIPWLSHSDSTRAREAQPRRATVAAEIAWT
jgi:hypothetical protein